MGDRCYLWTICKKTDQERVDKELSGGYGANEEDAVVGDDTVICLAYEEVNYGGCEELEALAKEGIVFVGHHSEGSVYPAEEFCSVNGLLMEIVTIDGTPCAVLDDETLTVSDNEQDFLIRYGAHRAAACAALGLTQRFDSIKRGGD